MRPDSLAEERTPSGQGFHCGGGTGKDQPVRSPFTLLCTFAFVGQKAELPDEEKETVEVDSQGVKDDHFLASSALWPPAHVVLDKKIREQNALQKQHRCHPPLTPHVPVQRAKVDLFQFLVQCKEPLLQTQKAALNTSNYLK
ncbi:hypothetical protein Q9233_011876 [Columba guinea]|nr:hypothetical protein Q9233_011876 [Columba guinea]